MAYVLRCTITAKLSTANEIIPSFHIQALIAGDSEKPLFLTSEPISGRDCVARACREGRCLWRGAGGGGGASRAAAAMCRDWGLTAAAGTRAPGHQLLRS
ncbi:unnamed protein product [Plutella xylostella]|uniref:(diamondback moth) hypothetical protein n=1 Tax=Plutella xylostella TaxID=51655 RepID=A0A8S4E8G1_PLUXY|nr:unnamed protein product [Plutella xylostella]